MLKIGIILGSTRPNRVGAQVAAWVQEHASRRGDATYELVDLLDHPLPLLDEPLSPMLGQYQHEHTVAWAGTIAPYDGLVFVTPEYNHGLPGSLKNAIDYLHAEWRNKAVGIVSYGVAGGTGAAAQLRQICGQLGMADVSRQVVLNLHTDFENYSVLQPNEAHVALLGSTLDQLVDWSAALAHLRVEAAFAG
ncbi:NAD(P)H-dependent oxidoreductase [Nocardioides marmoriginsengisoli]|uniref:NAD(P)H-dependent oxidoreductase n=1 Tax=Nocardioides marmoriginsengisoli TaxID=661483 RepID=A0A3N0CMM2_9ACTN|nr:NADPH-dependent FMN reductase [Nocardioides marmoriginsengisoli]RNL64306.1 NAD(P)H-dependent oxidoreductase [Nocardioides marmoriginsengisoli]